MKKYKSIEILEEMFDLPTKIKVNYEDGSQEEITSKEDEVYSKEINHVLSTFGEQEGYENAYEFIKNSDKVIKKTALEDDKADIGATEKPLSPAEPEKKPKKRNALRIGAGLVAAVVGIGGISYVLVDHFSNKKGLGNGNNKTKTQYIEMVDYPEDEKDGLTDRVEVMDAKDETVREELIDVVDGKAQTKKDLEEFLSNQEALAWTNVTNISRFINGQKLTGDIYKTDFKSVYDEDTIDYVAVQYFEELRNNIIYAAYEENNVENTKNAVTAFDELFVKFVFGNKKLNYLKIKDTYDWDDLTPSAQNTILAIGMGVLTIEHDFSVAVNGETYNRLFAGEEAYKLKQEVYNNVLVQQDFYRKNSK